MDKGIKETYTLKRIMNSKLKNYQFDNITCDLFKKTNKKTIKIIRLARINPFIKR
jgi:hypothetical protein